MTNYFTELKIFWDELDNLRKIPSCTYATQSNEKIWRR